MADYVDAWRVRGRDGIEIDTQLIDIYEFRDGMLIRTEGLTDKAEAFKAVGLSE